MRTDDVAALSARLAAQMEAEGVTVNLIRASDLKPEPIDWLWREYLACGKLHIIAGAPGAGKTTIALAFAATLTSGGRWPDGTRAEPGNALIWSGEDDPKDTLLPRLIAMGADSSRVYFVGDTRADGKSRPFDPARDMSNLEREAQRIEHVRLFIVDPIVNAVAGDSHKNTETRRALQPIVDLASRLGAVALGISHFSKGTAGRDPVERVTGSIAFGAIARVVFGAAKSTDENGTKRLFVRAKSNIGPDGGGFGYDLEQSELKDYPGIIASRVLWGIPLDGTARELLAVAEAIEDQGSALHDTTDWLRDLLTEEGGTMDKRDIMRLARDNGFSERTVQRAREQLALKVRTTGFGKDKRSMWSIVPIMPIMPTENLGTHGTNGVGEEF
ncbi:MAG: AAA family ATPase [Pseudomonadota bacterium]